MSAPQVGETLTVTTRIEPLHHFRPGTRVKVLRDNADPRGRWEAHRWLCQGRGPTGDVIVQWLAAEDVTR